MNLEYLNLFFLNIFGSFFVLVLFIIFFLLIQRDLDFEKLSSYECGFNPFEDIYARFDIRFYLVAILFLLFDLEVTFVFPWCFSFSILQDFSFFLYFYF